MSSTRPNRSDVHLSTEEESKIEEETREYFDGVAPRRHTKPQRSDYSSQYSDVNNDATINPELVKFQDLENCDHQKLVYNGSEVPEEYVETEYYKDMECIDKQHHTTGTGFIRAENANANFFKLAPDFAVDIHSYKGNPATNDWVPTPADATETLLSSKPNRSDN